MKLSERQVNDFYKWLVSQLGLETDEESYVYRNYSGRGMYGKTCVGVVTNNIPKTVAELCLDAQDEADSFFDDVRSNEFMSTVRSVFSRVCQDNMGRSSIIYFPTIHVENVIENKDDE